MNFLTNLKLFSLEELPSLESLYGKCIMYNQAYHSLLTWLYRNSYKESVTVPAVPAARSASIVPIDQLCLQRNEIKPLN